jgi:site-specific recombinase XerD
MSFQAVVDDYAVWHEISGHSPKTIQWYRWMLTVFVQWLERNGRSTHLAAITIADARAFLKAEAQRTTIYPGHPTGVERAGQLSDRTLHGYARALRAFFNWLVNEEYLDKNPLARLRPPKLEKRYKEILSVGEIERLLAELNQRTFLRARIYAMVAVLYDSGLRAGELVQLDIGDVDWSAYHLRVMGKGKKERLVPFSPATARVLLRFRHSRHGTRRGRVWNDGGAWLRGGHGSTERVAMPSQHPFQRIPNVLHQVPPVGHLYCGRRTLLCALGVDGTAITRDRGHPRMRVEPMGYTRSGALRQQIDGVVRVQINEQGPVRAAAPEAKSSTPSACGEPAGTTGVWRMRRNRVSGLVAMPSGTSSRAPGSPPRANATCVSTSVKRTVRRARGRARSGRRSAKIRRG